MCQTFLFKKVIIMRKKIILTGFLLALILPAILVINLYKTNTVDVINKKYDMTQQSHITPMSGSGNYFGEAGETIGALVKKDGEMEFDKKPENQDFQVKDNEKTVDEAKQNSLNMNNGEIKCIQSENAISPDSGNTEDFADKEERQTVTLSIDCKTVLNNIDMLNKDKLKILPKDGLILSPTDVGFENGDSAFDILIKILRENKIHIDFVNTLALGSSYIKGIGNIYEFDCGELSGWLYIVNGQLMSYGSSNYIPSAGDIIEWRYSCDLGNDLGD